MRVKYLILSVSLFLFVNICSCLAYDNPFNNKEYINNAQELFNVLYEVANVKQETVINNSDNDISIIDEKIKHLPKITPENFKKRVNEEKIWMFQLCKNSDNKQADNIEKLTRLIGKYSNGDVLSKPFDINHLKIMCTIRKKIFEMYNSAKKLENSIAAMNLNSAVIRDEFPVVKTLFDKLKKINFNKVLIKDRIINSDKPFFCDEDLELYNAYESYYIQIKACEDIKTLLNSDFFELLNNIKTNFAHDDQNAIGKDIKVLEDLKKIYSECMIAN